MHADFVLAMRDNPDDTLLPLVYADWLEEQGEADRAEWVRLGCAIERPGIRARERDELWGKREQAWQRCKPSYWRRVEGVSETRHRGHVELVDATGFARSSRWDTSWLPQAVAAGWLGAVTFLSMARPRWEALVKAWQGASRGVPLNLTFTRHAWDRPPNLAELPDLEGVLTTEPQLVPGLADAIAACPSLQRAHVDVTNLGVPGLTDMLDAIAALPNLRRLALASAGRFQVDARPNDADLQRLTPLARLRVLKLWHCRGVTAAGLARLREAIPRLVVVRDGDEVPGEPAA